MPEEKKAANARTARPKAVKARQAKDDKIVAKPKAKPLAKRSVGQAPLAEGKARKTRGPNKTKGTFADLLKIQTRFEIAKKDAKADLKKQYESLIEEAEKIKSQYVELFSESIESAPKAKTTGVKKAKAKAAGAKSFTLKEIGDFIEQKKAGLPIKLAGRRAKSIEKMELAYKKTEEPEEILKALNQ